MDLQTGLSIPDGLVWLTMFVGAPLLSAAIGYAAWKGRPRNFNRENYGMSLVVSGAAGVFLIVVAQRMQADVRTPQFLVELACFGLGVVLLGIAGGCALGVLILTYRRNQKK